MTLCELFIILMIIYCLIGITPFVYDCLLPSKPKEKEECSHEWHADQDNYCNFCVKCGATQEIYYDPPYNDIPINGDTPKEQETYTE